MTLVFITDDTFISNQAPANNEAEYTILHIGGQTVEQERQILLKFDIPDLDGRVAEDIELCLYQFFVPSHTSNFDEFKISLLEGSWDVKTITWETLPNVGEVLFSAKNDITETIGKVCFKIWTSGGGSNLKESYGLLLTGRHERYFYSSEWESPSRGIYSGMQSSIYHPHIFISTSPANSINPSYNNDYIEPSGGSTKFPLIPLFAGFAAASVMIIIIASLIYFQRRDKNMNIDSSYKSSTSGSSSYTPEAQFCPDDLFRWNSEDSVKRDNRDKSRLYDRDHDTNLDSNNTSRIDMASFKGINGHPDTTIDKNVSRILRSTSMKNVGVVRKGLKSPRHQSFSAIRKHNLKNKQNTDLHNKEGLLGIRRVDPNQVPHVLDDLTRDSMKDDETSTSLEHIGEIVLSDPTSTYTNGETTKDGYIKERNDDKLLFASAENSSVNEKRRKSKLDQDNSEKYRSASDEFTENDKNHFERYQQRRLASSAANNSSRFQSGHTTISSLTSIPNLKSFPSGARLSNELGGDSRLGCESGKSNSQNNRKNSCWNPCLHSRSLPSKDMLVDEKPAVISTVENNFSNESGKNSRLSHESEKNRRLNNGSGENSRLSNESGKNSSQNESRTFFWNPCLSTADNNFSTESGKDSRLSNKSGESRRLSNESGENSRLSNGSGKNSSQNDSTTFLWNPCVYPRSLNSKDLLIDEKVISADSTLDSTDWEKKIDEGYYKKWSLIE